MGELKTTPFKAGSQSFSCSRTGRVFLECFSLKVSANDLQKKYGSRTFDFADTAPEGAWSCTSPILGEKTPSKASLKLAAALNSNSAVAHSLAVQDQTEQNRC